MKLNHQAELVENLVTNDLGIVKIVTQLRDLRLMFGRYSQRKSERIIIHTEWL
jgi:hypothetical protein